MADRAPILPPRDADLVASRLDPPSAVRESQRARPAGRVEQDTRRLASAGHGLVVCLLALVFAAMLNAAGAHKRAYNQPDGWKRTVALALTGPLESVSNALLLDRPRAAVLTVMGRSGDDEIDTDLGIEVVAPAPVPSAGRVPNAPAEPKPVPVAAAGRQRFTPQHPLRLWVAGDSLVITPGYAILRAADANGAVTPVGGVDGRVATGLTRPDVFNWFREIRDRVQERKLNAVVLSFGGNDDKAYMTGLPDGVTIGGFGDPAWKREYGRRVGALFDVVHRAGAHTIWIGLPQTDDAEQTRRFDVVNAVVVAEARQRPGSVTYIDTGVLLAGADGGYAQYLDLPGRGSVKVRADDGVHFERAGGDLIAAELLRALGKERDLTSWRNAPAP